MAEPFAVAGSRPPLPHMESSRLPGMDKQLCVGGGHRTTSVRKRDQRNARLDSQIDPLWTGERDNIGPSEWYSPPWHFLVAWTGLRRQD